MTNFMFQSFVCLVLFIAIVCSEADLQQQHNEEFLNPINDSQYGEHTSKDHDKRTIFTHKRGWAKHVGIHPSGFKYVIGYGPVDYKYVPVVKPISIQTHHPHIHVKPLVLKPFLPVRPVIHQDGWKPIVPIVKPVIPVVKPVVPIVKPVPVNVPAHIPHNPWQQDGWVHPVPVVKPIVPIVPSKPLVPLVPAPKPFYPAHLYPIGTGGLPLYNPALVGQYAPASVEYHGTHNYVPVAPLTPFPQLPIPPHHHHYPIHQVPQRPVVVQTPQYPHVHHSHPQNPVVLQQAPQYPVPHLHHQHPVVQQPHEQHEVQTPLIPQDHPLFQHQLPEGHLHHHHQDLYPEGLPEHAHLYHTHVPDVYHQQLPVDPQDEFRHAQEEELYQHHHHVEQQLPVDPQGVFHHHHEGAPSGPVLIQQHLPGNVQHLFNQQIQHGDGATSNILLHGATIQPGHTDVQVPEHLPQHPNYLPPGQDPYNNPERPSLGLEPPYTHK